MAKKRPNLESKKSSARLWKETIAFLAPSEDEIDISLRTQIVNLVLNFINSRLPAKSQIEPQDFDLPAFFELLEKYDHLLPTPDDLLDEFISQPNTDGFDDGVERIEDSEDDFGDHFSDHDAIDSADLFGDLEEDVEVREYMNAVSPKNFFEALDLAQQAIESHSPEHRNNLLQKAVEMCPGCVDAWLGLGDFEPIPQKAVDYYMTGFENAAWMLNAPYSEHRTEELLKERYIFLVMQIANSLWKIGEVEKSLAMHQALDKLTMEDVYSHRLQYAFRLFEQKEEALLKKQLTKLRSCCSSDSGVEFIKVLMEYGKAGDSEKAQKALKKAHRRNPLVVKYLLGAYEYPDVEDIEFDDEEFEREEESHWLAAAITSAARPYEHFTRWVRKTVDYVAPPPAYPPEKTQEDLERISRGLQTDAVWLVNVHPHAGGIFVIVYNVVDAELVEVDAQDDEPTPESIFQVVIESMLKSPDEECIRPAKMIVHDENVASYFAEHLEPLGTEVTVDLETTMPEELMDEINQVMEVVEEKVDFDDATVDLVNSFERSDETWHVGVFQTPLWIDDEATPRRSHLAIAMDEDSGLIRIHELSSERPTPDFLATTILKGMIYPPTTDFQQSVPARILVHPHTNIEMVRKLTECLDIELERMEGDTHEMLDKAIYDFIVHCSDSSLKQSLLDSAGLSIDELRDFYRDVARFYQSNPWKRIPSDRLIKISSPFFDGKDLFVSIIGQEELHLGLVASFDGDGMKSIVLNKQRDDGGLSVTLLNFGEQHEIAPIDLWTMEQHDCDVANANAYPTIQHSLSVQRYCRPNREALASLHLALNTIPEFSKVNDSLELTLEVTILYGTEKVTVGWCKS